MRYFDVVPSKFVCANSNFQKEFPFCVPVPLMKRQGMTNIFPCQMCYSQDECLFTCHCMRVWQVIGMPSLEMNRNFIYVVNNKFLDKCWYGRHLWIRLAMDCERMVEKEINFILCLGTSYDLSSMEDIRNSWSFSLTGKACLSKLILSLNLSFDLQHFYKSLLPSAKGLSIYFMQFLFLFESPSSLIKHQLGNTIIIVHQMQLIFECVSCMDQ